MRALVVVESMFGNTRLVAEAIAEGIYGFIPMDVFRVDDAPTKIAPEVALLVVGGPTHAFGMSRPRTREDAMTQSGEADAAGIGMREWLGSIEDRPMARGLLRLTPASTSLEFRDQRLGEPGSVSARLASQ